MSEASTSTSAFDPAKQEALAAYRKVSARLSSASALGITTTSD